MLPWAGSSLPGLAFGVLPGAVVVLRLRLVLSSPAALSFGSKIVEAKVKLTFLRLRALEESWTTLAAETLSSFVASPISLFLTIFIK